LFPTNIAVCGFTTAPYTRHSLML